MSSSINRRQFATGILAAGVAGKAMASSQHGAVIPEQLHLKPNGWMPNNTLPVLIYRNALPVTGDLTDTMERFPASDPLTGPKGALPKLWTS
jgi:hypothetical protein